MNSRHDYKYPIEQCDILNKEKGEMFRRKRSQWIEWLYSEDPLSISNQIYSMLWNYALYCVVNELRRIAVVEPDSRVGFNGPIIRLLDAGFATTQAMTIRRLIEKPKPNPKLAIISIRSILKDIKDNFNLITRENYICHDGLPYDYEALHKESISNMLGRISTLPTEGPNAWPVSKMGHENFDKLSQVTPTYRERDDCIKIEVLEHLETKIDECKNIKTYVDKFIAHTAAPETRINLTDNETIITLELLKNYHKIIYQVVCFISGSLLWESSLGGLPVPQYNHLKNLDKRWANPRNLEKARNKWREFESEVSSWNSASLWPPNFKID